MKADYTATLEDGRGDCRRLRISYLISSQGSTRCGNQQGNIEKASEELVLCHGVYKSVI